VLFHTTSRTRKLVATVMAVGLIGATATGAVSAARQGTGPPPAAKRAAVTKSTVPKALTRAETAAEDVIGFLEQGKPAKSKAEARILRDLAHGKAADVLRQAGVNEASIRALHKRADRTAALSATNASALRVSLAANSVSQLMPRFYGLYQDPVPASVLKLDYLERQIQLESKAGNRAGVDRAVRQLGATWSKLRAQLASKPKGQQVAKSYDKHVRALEQGGTATATQAEAVNGLDLVDQMEGVFLGK